MPSHAYYEEPSTGAVVCSCGLVFTPWRIWDIDKHEEEYKKVSQWAFQDMPDFARDISIWDVKGRLQYIRPRLEKFAQLHRMEEFERDHLIRNELEFVNKMSPAEFIKYESTPTNEPPKPKRKWYMLWLK